MKGVPVCEITLRSVRVVGAGGDREPDLQMPEAVRDSPLTRSAFGWEGGYGLASIVVPCRLQLNRRVDRKLKV